MLAAHNQFRKVHAVEPLTMNEEMNAEATEYAQKLAKTTTYDHAGEADNPKGDGENILVWPQGDVNGYSGTQLWYRVVKDYDWNNPSSTQGAGEVVLHGTFVQVYSTDIAC